MRELASLKNCPCLPGAGEPPYSRWIEFYRPDPSPEAREAFKQYCKCRWPIHVFTLDPVTADQNVGTSARFRREMQVAMAIAASQRLVGAQSVTRMARRLEYDLDTVDLNRTAYGFAHGADTFGWRFEPRIQAPPPPGILGAACETIVGGPSRQRRLASRRLEPQMRECTAIIVMPSFVPYVTVDVKTNWYKLGCLTAGMRKMDTADALDLSADVVRLKRLASTCLKDADRYREGEVHRLCSLVDNLDRQMPLQTHFVPIPYENRLGGFELFNAGVTDLAPELRGFYGAPGVVVSESGSAQQRAVSAAVSSQAALAEANARVGIARLGGNAEEIAAATGTATEVQAAATRSTTAARAALAGSDTGGTTLYLVGRNFSVFGNSVIAGGLDVTDSVQPVSREVMRVTIPGGVAVETFNGKCYVDVHLATPYGVTSHLRIPAVPRRPGECADLGGAAAAADPPATARVETLEAKVSEVETTLSAQTEGLELSWHDPPGIEVTATHAPGGKLAALEAAGPAAGQPLALNVSADPDTLFAAKPATWQAARVGFYAQFSKDGKPVGSRHSVRAVQVGGLDADGVTKTWLTPELLAGHLRAVLGERWPKPGEADTLTLTSLAMVNGVNGVQRIGGALVLKINAVSQPPAPAAPVMTGPAIHGPAVSRPAASVPTIAPPVGPSHSPREVQTLLPVETLPPVEEGDPVPSPPGW